MSSSLYRRRIRPLLPTFVFVAWRRVRPIVERLRSAWGAPRLRRVRRELRREFGPGFVPVVAKEDEMAAFLQSALGVPRTSAEAEYLRSGRGMLVDLEAILDRVGRPLTQVRSFLEFACGYGRFTRFGVTRVPPGTYTASDIDPSAVAFVGRTFGVQTIRSDADPSAVTVDARFDVIFVASLFSHLALPYWTAWAAKLVSLLNPGGVLVFSVHGPHALNQMPVATSAALDQVAPGFSYGGMNETGGRLDGAYYGAAFVTEEFVRGQFDATGRGRVIDVVPRGLWDFQDVYTVRAPG